MFPIFLPSFYPIASWFDSLLTIRYEVKDELELENEITAFLHDPHISHPIPSTELPFHLKYIENEMKDQISFGWGHI